MTFAEIQNAVMNDRFKETQRSDIKNWINFRLAWVWDIDDWTFKKGRDLVTVTANSSTVTRLPTDLGTVRNLRRADGARLTYLDGDDFDDLYYGQTSTGLAEHYSVVNGAISVGPISSESSTTYSLFYEKSVTMLSADADSPTIPSSHHFMLVHGGAAEGLKLQNDPTWQAFEQDFQADIATMRRQYLTDHRGEYETSGRDPIGY